MSFEPDCQRLCKYLFLKPTAFRKKPTLYSQKFSLAPLEIEFFGATGTSMEDCDINSGASVAERAQAVTTYDLQVLTEGRVLKNVSGVEI